MAYRFFIEIDELVRVQLLTRRKDKERLMQPVPQKLLLHKRRITDAMRKGKKRARA